MTVDLSNLSLKQEDIDVADDAIYAEAQEFPPPPPEGVYTFIQGKPEFKPTGAGFLSAEMTQTITGGEFDGVKIMYDRISDKPFERQGVKVSMAKDQIRAVFPQGAPERSARTHQEYANALAAGEGKPFKAAVIWDGFCKHTGTPQEVTDNKAVLSIKGARNFPNGGDAKCTVCGQGIRPRAKINRRISL
jgi:hypothetical protein